tara:strand:+ start:7949 stop:8992 length:1044 start_codon:yes stop_codon:yes gene_type:complete
VNHVAENRNIVMDWLRGLGAMWVVLFHINEPIPFESTPWRWFCKYGWLGVPVFFAVSGYCMAMLADKNPAPQRFLTSRWTRILIPYWGSLVVVLGVVSLRLLVTGVNDVTALPQTVVSLLATLTLTTKPVTNIPAVNWVYWSLSYELAFYLIVALALFSRKTTVAIFLVFCGSVVGFFFVPSALTWSPFFWCDKFPLFLAGWYGFQCITNRCAWYVAVMLIAVLVAGVWMTSLIQVVAAAIATSLVMLGSRVTNTKFLDSKLSRGLQALGAQSYSLYLLHVPVGVYLFCRLRPAFSSQIGHIVFDLAVLVGCVITAWIFYRLVEVPAHHWARNLSNKRSANVAPAGS